METYEIVLLAILGLIILFLAVLIIIAPEEERILFSPATVEMGGIGIVANRESFDRLTPSKLRDIIREVADTPYPIANSPTCANTTDIYI